LHRVEEKETDPVDEEREPVHADILQPASVDGFSGFHLVFLRALVWSCRVFKIFLRLCVPGKLGRLDLYPRVPYPIVQAPLLTFDQMWVPQRRGAQSGAALCRRDGELDFSWLGTETRVGGVPFY
jgi:hypothetical protein